MSTPPKHTHIWLDPAEVAVLPTSGAAWANLQKAVEPDPKVPDLKNQDDHTPVVLMAHGLHFMRTGSTRSRDLAQARCLQAIGTEAGGRALAISRNLLPLLVAADCVGQRTPAFVEWVDHVRKEVFTGGPKTLAETHIVRPNNWGTHAGASCLAAAMFLKDIDDVHLHADVWKEWLGASLRAQYAAQSRDKGRSAPNFRLTMDLVADLRRSSDELIAEKSSRPPPQST